MILTHPEHVVDEQSSQQDAASADIIEVEQLDSVQGESQTEQVIGDPVLSGDTEMIIHRELRHSLPSFTNHQYVCA